MSGHLFLLMFCPQRVARRNAIITGECVDTEIASLTLYRWVVAYSRSNDLSTPRIYIFRCL